MWWRDAVIYQIYPRSFADGNGDGIGDIAGIRAHLDYLVTLGVDAVWITPWYPSPMIDGGYDVADYRGVDPMFGTLAEAEKLIAQAHHAGLRVLLDIVPNHTSDQHKWFQAALAGNEEARQRYIFRPGKGQDGAAPPNDWTSAFGGSAWTRVSDGSWYLHLFAPAQPDLNWRHPQVRAEFEDILAFWFDRGVDGFRIDVAHGLIKDPDLPDLGSTTAEQLLAAPDRNDHPHWDQEEVQEIYEGWRRLADSYDPPRTFVAEVWIGDPVRMARYLRPGRLHTAFNFDFLRAAWTAHDLRGVIERTITELGAPPTWVLSNHDMVRVATRYGRPMGQELAPVGTAPVDLTLGTRRARAAALLMLGLPGGAYIYQGEELGLPEVEDLPESSLQDPTWERSEHADRGRDGCRVPFPWHSDGASFGFSEESTRPWLPAPAWFAEYSVECEQQTPQSTLRLYQRALQLRRDLRIAASDRAGEQMKWLPEYGTEVIAFERGDGWRVLVNCGGTPVRLPATADVILASDELVGGQLPPDTAVWMLPKT